jgi:outer membrane autotransporter protein
MNEVLGFVSQEHTSTQGTSQVETAPNQVRTLGARLAALRRGAVPQISLQGFNLDIGGKNLSAAQLLSLDQKGGGASADANGGRFGVFLNGNGSFGTKDGTPQEFGYDHHTGGVTAGADYRVTDNLILGGAFRWLSNSATLNNALGDVSSNSYGGSLYGSYYIGAFHVDVLGGFAWINYDTDRNIVYPGVTRTATGSTSGQEYTTDVTAGYDFRWGGFTATPYGRVDYLNATVESYTESGAQGLNLTIQSQRLQSLRTALGLQLSYAFSVPFGVLVPQIRGEWLHEYLNGSRPITAQFTNDPFGTAFFIPTDSPSRNFAGLSAGVSSVFAKGFSAFVNFDTFLGLTNVSNYMFTGGVRLEF